MPKPLPFGAHLALEVLSVVVLAISPWLFGFADRVWLPQVLLGVVERGRPECAVRTVRAPVTRSSRVRYPQRLPVDRAGSFPSDASTRP